MVQLGPPSPIGFFLNFLEFEFFYSHFWVFISYQLCDLVRMIILEKNSKKFKKIQENSTASRIVESTIAHLSFHCHNRLWRKNQTKKNTWLRLTRKNMQTCNYVVMYQ